MASNHTPAYGLNQWSLDDNFVMEDFNTDNRNIEQALLELKAALPKFQSGSYVGTGTGGAGTPNSLTFDFEPKLVILVQETKQSDNMAPTVCIRGMTQMVSAGDPGNYPEFRPEPFYMSWDGNTFSWYATYATYQFNRKDTTYHYMAIG
ncbi:MAG: hypothetical protein IJA11_04955 [Oscillospiraceae bacterium]|nr:hypothetical protein [Oscillospiraceae bacterium]